MSQTAVAISGGGHRACLFGLGSLLYLAEATKSKDVRSIASVSGGSMANAAVAQELDFTTAPANEVAELVARTGDRVARGTLFAAPLTWLYLMLALPVMVIALAGPWTLDLSPLPRLTSVLAGALFGAWFLALRGWVASRAFASTLYSPRGRATKLREISPALDHTICATDLHRGENVYFSGRFVCSRAFGLGVPGDLPLHTAVRCSASFPGAFPAARLRTGRHRFEQPGQEEAATHRLLALVDGGVYDNMADQWASDLEARGRQWAALEPDFRSVDELVVVSGSAGLGWRSQRRLSLPLIGEVLTLGRDVSVLYDNGNSVRRRLLVRRFDQADRDGKGLRGGLVHIEQSPFKLPEAYAEADETWPERAARARVALTSLERSGLGRAEWARIAAENSAVKTTLRGLGHEVSARILHHAYVLAMVNLHVLLDYPLLEIPGHQRFEQLIRHAREGHR